MAFEALISSFLTNLGEAGSRAVDTDQRLADILGHMVEVGQRAWPRLTLEPKTFIAHVAARMPTDRPDLAAALGELRVEDLYLACACSTGVAHARELLRDHVRSTVEACASRMDTAPAFVNEVEEGVIATLLAAEAGQGEPHIAGYRGRRPLTAWVGVAVERMALALLRERGARVPKHERAVAAQMALGQASELAYLRRYYEDDFENAFTQALSSLTDRERALLRLHLGANLGMPALALMYRVPESTVGQWIDDARAALADETEANLKRRLRISPAEFDSLARLLPTQLEARITQLSRDANPPPASARR